jgi:hypothetical protein
MLRRLRPRRPRLAIAVLETASASPAGTRMEHVHLVLPALLHSGSVLVDRSVRLGDRMLTPRPGAVQAAANTRGESWSELDCGLTHTPNRLDSHESNDDEQSRNSKDCSLSPSRMPCTPSIPRLDTRAIAARLGSRHTTA